MKVVTPDYYKDFHCTGSNCRHNCCCGWEIDIDDETADSYAHMQGALGRRLGEEICHTASGSYFRLTDTGRCPFLNNENLCDIIRELGEEGLCIICTDHPRFRADGEDRVELGLGMACEEAARLLLTHRAPVHFLEESTDAPTDEETVTVFGDRRSALMAVAQDRTRSIEGRIRRIARMTGLDGVDLTTENWIGFYADLEQMEADSPALLADFMHAVCTRKAKDASWRSRNFELEAEQVLVYFLYRYLPHARNEVDFRARVGFALLSCIFLKDQWSLAKPQEASLPEAELIDLARRYSTEVEYSEENVGRILAALRREIRDRDRAAG